MSLFNSTRSGHPFTWRTVTNCRPIYTPSGSNTIIDIPKANVYRFGDSNKASPVFEELEWTVKEGENWAVISAGRGGQKTALLQMLLGHLRISPSPPAGLFPFLSAPASSPGSGPWRDPSACISVVSFTHRQRSSGGAFYDYTARYGAVREEDRITLRQNMFPETGEKSELSSDVFNKLSERLGLQALLDLPLVALSNGQTRRARILKALLSKPELLLLDEPLTGLDVGNRSIILSLLRSLHATRSPRVIMGLRGQDPVPEWISHVALVEDRSVFVGPKDVVLAGKQHLPMYQTKNSEVNSSQVKTNGAVVVEMKNVTVAYHERQVLKGITWTIREGDRYHLQGSNGSGKTTLLSLLTGDHPQSYTQIAPKAQLTLFGRRRARIPTPELASLIGVVSPELANAFPRRAGMTVWDAVGTGFDGVFVPGGQGGVGIGLKGGLEEQEKNWRIGRMWEVLNGLAPYTWVQGRGTSLDGAEASVKEFAARSFVDLSAGEQSMVLFMRALVGKPRLVLLDEVWSGMDDGMIAAARAYLRADGVSEDQAVVFISHWVEEVPWSEEDGVKRFRLENGEGSDI